MTKRIEKTVFISYRRTNLPWALAIYQDLTKHGYDVFFDYQSINSGDFEQVILSNIKARAHFLILLTPSALERCNNPSDWLRREIETAIDEKRNIVPLFIEGFDFGNPSISKNLIGKLEILKSYNGLRIPADFFEEAMRRLRSNFLNITLDAVLHPISDKVQETVQRQKNAANKATKVKELELSAQIWLEKGVDLDNNSDEEIYCYTQAIKINPNLAYAYYNRGIIYLDRNEYKRAIKDFTIAIQLDNNDGDFFCNRGIALKNNSQTKLAMEDFTEAIRLNPKDEEYYLERGIARAERGDIDDAIKDYAKAISVREDFSEALYNRAALWIMKKKFSNALSDYQRYLDAGGGNKYSDTHEIEAIIKDLKKKR
jgi:Flp pilus assembly protein TadD